MQGIRSTEYLERLERDMLAGMLHLLVLAHLKAGPAHGYGLIRAMEQSTGKGIWKEGTVYPLLAALERDGFVLSRWGEGDAGPRRKYYELTAAGRAALRMAKEHWRELRDRMDQLVEAKA